MAITIGQLFEPEPAQWGLRGDPCLWRKMREHFSAAPLPPTLADFEQSLEHAFQELSGQPLCVLEAFFVAELAHGGMSGGWISPQFWREQAIPSLRQRYARGRD